MANCGLGVAGGGRNLDADEWNGEDQSGVRKALFFGYLTIKRAEIVQGDGEQFCFVFRQVSLGLIFEHFEGIQDGLGRPEIDLVLSGVRIGELAEKHSGVLSLNEEEFAKTGIGLRLVGHGHIIERIDGVGQA